ncbi:CST complex subunit TEN1 isoform X2 [Cheilinus undulatus]|uniref:CST complex subunit TEN1 isoform X2 n=1 Tax=Cheilinus undulatus TaxID=241271 RepID=UPI001BD1D387|nr:CST complex subunit TEN1 isoform X2 [Cheilinus undulatus]
MLPGAAVFHFLWEINSGALKEGESVRVFGRLSCYQPEESRATLSAQHASKEHQMSARWFVLVCSTVSMELTLPFYRKPSMSKEASSGRGNRNRVMLHNFNMSPNICR